MSNVLVINEGRNGLVEQTIVIDNKYIANISNEFGVVVAECYQSEIDFKQIEDDCNLMNELEYSKCFRLNEDDKENYTIEEATNDIFDFYNIKVEKEDIIYITISKTPLFRVIKHFVSLNRANMHRILIIDEGYRDVIDEQLHLLKRCLGSIQTDKNGRIIVRYYTVKLEYINETDEDIIEYDYNLLDTDENITLNEARQLILNKHNLKGEYYVVYVDPTSDSDFE